MEEQKNREQPELREEPEEYSFLQEVIKDETQDPARLKRKLLRLSGFGFVFGIAACVSFCLFQPWISSRFSEEPKEVTIPKDEEEIPAAQKTDVKSEDAFSEEKFGQMMGELDGAARRVKKSVVELTFAAEDEASGNEAKAQECLSGVIVADNGQELLILGQTYDGKKSENVRVSFVDGASCRAVVKMSDQNLGCCIYAVSREEIKEKTWKKIEVATLGSSYAVEKGDVGILVGKPFGYEDAVSYGRVTSCGEKAKKADGQYGYLGVEAAGFSGGSGVIVNTDGQVIGMIEQEAANRDNMDVVYGYGISDIKGQIERLSNGAGVPYVGIFGVDVTEKMTQEREMPRGVYVEEIEADSPAMEAGIQSGDVITAVGGEEVNSFQLYHNRLMEKEEGGELVLEGFRKGAGDEYVEMEFTVTIGTKK